MYDLHTHTVHSDGRTTPSENARMAAAAGLRGLAVTDHDTVAGWGEAARACAAHGLDFVPGIELSTEDPLAGGHSVHLLGYFVDGVNDELAAECERLCAERDTRAERILARLAEHGVDVPLEAVKAFAGDAPVGRPHIAEALVEAGVVADTRAAFDSWLAEGRPAYVGKHAVSPERGVALIRAAGGAAVLAHPGLDRAVTDDTGDPGHAGSVGADRVPVDGLDLLDRLVGAGLAGVEADHSGHDGNMRRVWSAAAAARGLLVTGSSDFHARYAEERIGSDTTPTAVVDALRERASEGIGALATEGREPW